MNVVREVYALIPPGGRVLDIGCLGLRQHQLSQSFGRRDLHHSGTDLAAPEGVLPEGYVFRAADLDEAPVPFEDDSFDLVVASHVLEHLREPVAAVGEFLRVCRPGGILYVEAPSERSLLLPGMPFEHEKFYSTSYFDDPTHVSRPWTPQAFFRLTRYYRCEPLRVGYRSSRRARLLLPWYLLRAVVTRDGGLLESCLWNAVGWASFVIVRKPESTTGRPPFRYSVPSRL